MLCIVGLRAPAQKRKKALAGDMYKKEKPLVEDMRKRETALARDMHQVIIISDRDKLRKGWLCIFALVAKKG